MIMVLKAIFEIKYNIKWLSPWNYNSLINSLYNCEYWMFSFGKSYFPFLQIQIEDIKLNNLDDDSLSENTFVRYWFNSSLKMADW